MKKLVIFDLDGTLLDTLEDIRECINVVLENNGYKTLSKSEVLKCVGYGAKKLVYLAANKPDDEKWEKMFNEYVPLQLASDNSKTVLYDGLDNVLVELKNRGYKLAIVSNKPDSVTQPVVKQKLGKYGFDFITGNRPELFNPKPDKSCVEYCLNTLSIKKEDAIFVGDSEVDVQTFKGAGVDGIGVLWGFRPKEMLVDAGCERFAENAEQLLNEIIKM
ncbi:MAG: HAD family hydrolase [Clostridiales bacterium]|nr:HAD family hydrolase [Clostridiales bacterium]